jgi:hypothetical protein
MDMITSNPSFSIPSNPIWQLGAAAWAPAGMRSPGASTTFSISLREPDPIPFIDDLFPSDDEGADLPF